MSNQFIHKVSEKTLKLEAFFQECSFDQFLPYPHIKKQTGIDVTVQPGRGYMMSAFRRLRWEYRCTRGQGITIFGPQTAIDIVGQSLVSVTNSVDRLGRRHKNITDNFLGKVDAGVRNQLIFVGAAIGAIGMASDYYRKNLANKEVIQIGHKFEWKPPTEK